MYGGIGILSILAIGLFIYSNKTFQKTSKPEEPMIKSKKVYKSKL